MRATWTMVAGLAAAVAAMGACDGSGSPKSGSEPAPSTSSATAGSATSTPPAPTGRSVRLFCQSTETLDQRVTEAALSIGEDPAQIRRFVDELRAAAQEVAGIAPAEIAADTRVITDAVTAFADSLEQADYDPARTADDAAAALTGPEVQGASQRVEAYINAHCQTAR